MNNSQAHNTELKADSKITQSPMRYVMVTTFSIHFKDQSQVVLLSTGGRQLVFFFPSASFFHKALEHKIT